MVKAKLTLETSAEDINVTEAVNGLTIELQEFENEASALTSEIENFKSELNSDDLKLTPKEIKNKVKTFKSRLLNIKKEQVRRYNVRVELTNMLINEYKQKVPKDSLAYDLVISMEELTLCTSTVTEWRHNSYLSELDYNKLIEVNNKFKLVEEKLKEDQLQIEKGIEELKVQTEYVNGKILDLEVELSIETNYESLKQANDKLIELSELLISLGNALEKYKNNRDS